MLNRVIEQSEQRWVDCPLYHIHEMIKNHEPISVRVWIPNKHGGVWKSVISVWHPPGSGTEVAYYCSDMFMKGNTKVRPANSKHKFQVLYKPSKWRSYG